MNDDPPRLLAVCTANICRSPVAERALERALAESGLRVSTVSAGTHGGFGQVHAHTVAAAARIGIDLSEHRSQRLTRRLLDHAGTDLVITMTREHLYHVIATDEAAWPHTFTMVEIARRAEELASTGVTVGDFAAWASAMSADRRSVDLMPGRAADDIEDPYGRSRRHHRRMVELVDELARRTACAASMTIARPSASTS